MLPLYEIIQNGTVVNGERLASQQRTFQPKMENTACFSVSTFIVVLRHYSVGFAFLVVSLFFLSSSTMSLETSVTEKMYAMAVVRLPRLSIYPFFHISVVSLDGNVSRKFQHRGCNLDDKHY